MCDAKIPAPSNSAIREVEFERWLDRTALIEAAPPNFNQAANDNRRPGRLFHFRKAGTAIAE